MNITITYNNKNHVIIFITGSILTIWHNRCPLWVFDPTAAKTVRRGAFHPSSTEDTETTCGSLSVVSILASSPTAMDRDVKGGSINKRGTSTNNNMKNSWIQCQQKMWCIIGKLAYNSATRPLVFFWQCFVLHVSMVRWENTTGGTDPAGSIHQIMAQQKGSLSDWFKAYSSLAEPSEIKNNGSLINRNMHNWPHQNTGKRGFDTRNYHHYPLNSSISNCWYMEMISWYWQTRKGRNSCRRYSAKDTNLLPVYLHQSSND